MTDPKGRVFISYRRSPARPSGDAEAELVRDALRRVGVPTWRDLDDLSHEPTEDALIAAIEDPSLAGAVLLITPEVNTSDTVRKIEAVRIFRRYSAKNGFWVLPVLVDVDYDEANDILGSPAGFQDVNFWNIKRVAAKTLGSSDAFEIAQAAVKMRLTAIQNLEPGGPFSISIFGRRPPGISTGLVHDFSDDFHGREVVDGAYSMFEEYLKTSATQVLEAFPSARLIGEGVVPLPLGALVGAIYSPRAGFKLDWSQFVEGHDRQRWSFELSAEKLDLNIRVVNGDPSSEDLALAIGVSANIENATGDALRHFGVNCRAYLHCAPLSGSFTPGLVMTPEDGIGFVQSAIDKVRKVSEDRGMLRTNLHLFLACPLAMAIFLGQSLNTFSICHLYEHDPSANPTYNRVHTFHPSSFSYK